MSEFREYEQVKTLQKDLQKVLEMIPEGVALFNKDKQEVLLTNREANRLIPIKNIQKNSVSVLNKGTLLPVSQPESQIHLSISEAAERSSEPEQFYVVPDTPQEIEKHEVVELSRFDISF